MVAIGILKNIAFPLVFCRFCDMLHSASVHYEPPGNINFNSPKSAKKCFGKISRGPKNIPGGRSFPSPSSERQLNTEPPNRRGIAASCP